MNSPGPSAFDIQSHLYTSFLEGRTADVALRVRGRWSAIYRLHRVVLIQSDFFRSLFTSGFRESSVPAIDLQQESESINIVFDDDNISRSAFEICISRLYGGGPPLHVLKSLTPSISHPLTPSFLDQSTKDVVPDGQHPATPQFLLSLLATAIYLCIPSVASQALSLILKTIGPHTVVPYLNFALGKSIHLHHSQFFSQDSDAAVGLENVAQILVEDDRFPETLYQPQKNDITNIGTRFRLSTVGLHMDEAIELPAPQSSDSSDEDEGAEAESSLHHYGAISDKIGEACACWLVRWAIDLLIYEGGLQEDGHEAHSKLVLNSAETRYLGTNPNSAPVIWRHGGLDPAWVVAIISADTLFVRGERARYDFARSVVELRRRDRIVESEETHFGKIFDEGIYYVHMSVEDLIAISQDVSPTTKRPYVSLATLQAAHWKQSLLRHQITYKIPPMSSYQPSLGLSQPSSPPPRDKELGITVTTAELVRKSDEHNDFGNYYPVLADSSVRIGDNGSESSASSDGTPISMEDLFTFSHSLSLSPRRQSSKRTIAPKVAVNTTTKIASSEITFFGLQAQRHTYASAIALDPSGTQRWTQFPPCRFGVEFWDIDYLKEKFRLHSHTIWYAGSLFNVYIQIVKKKGQAQLGIYLHRQSSIEPIPAASAPSFFSMKGKQPTEGISELMLSAGRSSHSHGPSLTSMSNSPVLNSSPVTHYSPSIHPLSRSPISGNATVSVPSSPSFSPSSGNSGPATIPSTAMPITPPQPYRDPRSSISAYFAIACAGATGSSQMRFTSAPDVFSVSQSWGWKTSALRTEEYLEIGEEGVSDTVGRSPINSLRATVVLGLI